MSKPRSEVQDLFLNACRKEKIPVSLFLIKGVRLQGNIAGFGTYSILLRRDGSEQLVYKHGISTIVPSSKPTLDLPEFGGDGMQDQFLDRAEGGEVTVFLLNGVMLRGTLIGHDGFVLLLLTAEGPQLLFKHAVSTLQIGGERR